MSSPRLGEQSSNRFMDFLTTGYQEDREITSAEFRTHNLEHAARERGWGPLSGTSRTVRETICAK